MLLRTLSRFALPLAVLLAAAPAAAAAPAEPAEDGVRLKTAITVESDVVTLGDIFEGYIARPEKVVTRGPKPGQRMTLPAAWLAQIAHTYGLDWRPANSFDRAIVYQPGVTVTAGEIRAALKAALLDAGMPPHFDLRPSAPLVPVTTALHAPKGLEIREAAFDADGKQFSAVVQIPPGDPAAVFIPVQGTVYATMQVPVLKQAAGKTTTITAEMIDFISLPHDDVRPSTVIDPDMLVGKTPKLFLRPGQPVRETELTEITLIELPMLSSDLLRGERITADDITMLTIDAARAPRDAVTDADFLIGKSARRTLGANIPVRRGDVAAVHDIEVPVVIRDIPRGGLIAADDITWTTMNEADVVGEIVMDEAEIIGQVARLSLKGGQPVRKHTVAKPIAVDRGQLVTVQWSVKAINLTAQGHAMEKGSVGDIIRVTNTKSNQTLMAEVVDSRTVRVTAADQATR